MAISEETGERTTLSSVSLLKGTKTHLENRIPMHQVHSCCFAKSVSHFSRHAMRGNSAEDNEIPHRIEDLVCGCLSCFGSGDCLAMTIRWLRIGR